MVNPVREKFWHALFELGVLAKGFNGIWETLSGSLALFLGTSTFGHWFFLIARNELLEDPHDRPINFFVHVLRDLPSGAITFAAAYVLIHGILNIFLAIQLYRDRHWAYLVTIGAMLSFMAYQVYRISVYHSSVLTVLTVLDALFVALAWHEYKHHRERYTIAT